MTAVLDNETTIKQNTGQETKKAPLYKVILHNDDVNSFEHVILCVMQVFHVQVEEAFKLTKEANDTGLVICRVEQFEPAELHRDQLRALRLTADMEPE